jgi:hypothetical protein
MLYAFDENFVLPLSHDEVVHGKAPCSARCRATLAAFANLRLLLAWQWLFPGKKLLFMGGELAQPWEWAISTSCNSIAQRWRIGIAIRVASNGWTVDNRDQSVLAFLRVAPQDSVVVILNFTPSYPPRLPGWCAGTRQLRRNPEFGPQAIRRQQRIEPADHPQRSHPLARPRAQYRGNPAATRRHPIRDSDLINN